MKQARVRFPCGSLELEGLYYNAGQAASPAVAVCHPHPLHGGSMDNNVTVAVAMALAAVHINALLFNFRGVGSSGGGYGGGIEERKDVGAALDWLQQKPGVDRGRLGLAGYSFGAGVAFPVACADARVKGVALISPYFEVSPNVLLSACVTPKLFETGTADRVVLPEDVAGYAEKAADPKKALFISGPDHFWGGYEDELGRVVARFFKEIWG